MLGLAGRPCRRPAPAGPPPWPGPPPVRPAAAPWGPGRPSGEEARLAAADVAQAYAMRRRDLLHGRELLPLVASGVRHHQRRRARRQRRRHRRRLRRHRRQRQGRRPPPAGRLVRAPGRRPAIATGGRRDRPGLPARGQGRRPRHGGRVGQTAEASLRRTAWTFAGWASRGSREECLALLAGGRCYRGGYRQAVDGFAEVAALSRGRQRPPVAALGPGRAGRGPAAAGAGTPGRRWSCWRRPGRCSAKLPAVGAAPRPRRARPWSTCGLGATPKPGPRSGPGCAKPPLAGVPRMWLGEALHPAGRGRPGPAGARPRPGRRRRAPATGCAPFTAGCTVITARALRAGGLQLSLAGRRPKAVRPGAAASTAARRLDLPYDEAMAHLELGRHLRAPETTPAAGAATSTWPGPASCSRLGTEPALAPPRRPLASRRPGPGRAVLASRCCSCAEPPK